MKTAIKILLLSMPIMLLTANLAPAAEENAVPPAPAAAPGEGEMVAPPPPQEQERSMDRGRVFDRVLEKIKKDDPNEGARLEKLQKDDPKLFRTEIKKYMQKHEPGLQGDEQNRFRPNGMMDRERVREHMQAKEEELMTWLEKNEPAKAKELKALKEKDQPAYMRRIMLEMKNYRGIIEAEQTNPALAEALKKDLVLKQKRNDLLEQIKGATDETKKKELTEQLKDVVGQMFDLIVQKKQLKYEELKKKLEELQQSVNKSQAELESIKSKKTEQVEKRLQELLNQSEQIDWD